VAANVIDASAVEAPPKKNKRGGPTTSPPDTSGGNAEPAQKQKSAPAATKNKKKGDTSHFVEESAPSNPMITVIKPGLGVTVKEGSKITKGEQIKKEKSKKQPKQLAMNDVPTPAVRAAPTNFNASALNKMNNDTNGAETTAASNGNSGNNSKVVSFQPSQRGSPITKLEYQDNKINTAIPADKPTRQPQKQQQPSVENKRDDEEEEEQKEEKEDEEIKPIAPQQPPIRPPKSKIRNGFIKARRTREPGSKSYLGVYNSKDRHFLPPPILPATFGHGLQMSYEPVKLEREDDTDSTQESRQSPLLQFNSPSNKIEKKELYEEFIRSII